MDDDQEKRNRAFVADYSRKLDAGEPMMTFVLSAPTNLSVAGGVLVVDTATNMASPDGKVHMMRLLIPGNVAKGLRDYLNKVGFGEAGQQASTH